MRLPTTLIAAAALLGMFAAADAKSPDERAYAETAAMLAKLTPGQPTTCLSLTRSRESTFLDRDTIVYRDGTRHAFLNRTSGGCHFDDDSIIVSRTPSTQLCRGDILQLVDRSTGFPRGSCVLGDFVPYTR